jgi:hypothetical protein
MELHLNSPPLWNVMSRYVEVRVGRTRPTHIDSPALITR